MSRYNSTWPRKKLLDLRASSEIMPLSPDNFRYPLSSYALLIGAVLPGYAALSCSWLYYMTQSGSDIPCPAGGSRRGSSDIATLSVIPLRRSCSHRGYTLLDAASGSGMQAAWFSLCCLPCWRTVPRQQSSLLWFNPMKASLFSTHLEN